MKTPVVLKRAYRATGFAASTAAFGTGALIGPAMAKGIEAKGPSRDRITRAWSSSLLKLFDCTLVVDGNPGEPGIGRGAGRIVVANHRSIIDIAVMLSLFGGAVLSRGDLEHWPIIGRAAKNAGTIFVDRSSKKSGAQAIRAMCDRLELHDTICLFPEGTTYEDDEVRAFKAGAFVAAHRAHVPVVPVGIVYPLGSGAAFGGETFMQHPGRLAGSGGTRVGVEIGEPLLANEDEKTGDFAERCRVRVSELVARGRSKERS